MRISDWSSDVCSSDRMPAQHGSISLIFPQLDLAQGHEAMSPPTGSKSSRLQDAERCWTASSSFNHPINHFGFERVSYWPRTRVTGHHEMAGQKGGEDS